MKKYIYFVSAVSFLNASYSYEIDYEDEDGQPYSSYNNEFRPSYITDAEDEPLWKNFRTISLLSGYFSKPSSNLQLANLGLELVDAGDYFIEKIDVENQAQKILVGLGLSYLYVIFNVAYHEIGHGLRAKAFDLKYDLQTSNENNSSVRNRENFFGYYFRSLTKFSVSGSTIIQGTLSDYEKFVIAAGGVNNETYMAEQISDRIANGKYNGYFVPKLAYYLSKTGPLFYSYSNSNSSGNDINNMVTLYKNLGVNVNKGNIKTAYTATFVGGVLISGIESYFSKSVDSESSILSNIKTPDVFSYMTSYGISYKFVSGYKLSELTDLKFGFENIFKGDSKNEFSIGLTKRFESQYLPEVSGMLYCGCNGISFEGSVGFNLTSKLRLSCGGAIYSTRSLHGERMSKDIYKNSERIAAGSDFNWKKNRKSKTIWFGVSYVY